MSRAKLRGDNKPAVLDLGIENCKLPTQFEVWSAESPAMSADIFKKRFWRWPAQPVYFIADPHADPQAFIASLIATGGVQPNGSELLSFELTDKGAQAKFIIGGDCLGKGPNNLDLLRVIRQLKDLGAQVIMLAGNHDVRLLLALRSVGLQKNTATDHLFVNMVVKSMSLLKEVYEVYCQQALPDLALVKPDFLQSFFFPASGWAEKFKAFALPRLGEQRLNKELNRTFKKLAQFEKIAAGFELDLRQVYLAVVKCKELFLAPDGEFAWFFAELELLHQEDSFLYVHAGLDDQLINLLAANGADYLNRLYRYQVENDLFSFYYGPMANAIWTKYRDTDFALTATGVTQLQALGVYAVIHGHRSQLGGQHLRTRAGLIHIEADTTLNCNSRAKLGISDRGVAATVVHPDGYVLGVSSDCPFVKHFSPKVPLQPFSRILQAIFK